MKKKFIANFLFALIAIVSLNSCYRVKVSSTEEVVLTYQPWFFGHGGIDMTPIETGLTWCWVSTKTDTFSIVPTKYQVDMEDLISNDNTPLDFHTVIIIQVSKGKTPILLKNYGKMWWENNLYNFYCSRIRDHVSQYSPFDLMSNREVLSGIDKKILNEMQMYVTQISKDKEMPIEIKNVVMGRARPNTEQLNEMNKTAQAVQARQTQERIVEVELVREKAERQRARADKAYREELGLSTQDFISLKWIETIATKNDANIDVLVGANGTSNMWNIRR